MASSAETIESLGLNMSVSEFIQALSSAIVGKMGPASPFTKEEKTAATRQADENLEQMKKLTKGLEDLNKLLKTVNQTAGSKKSGGSGGPTIGNIDGALSKLAGNASLEKEALPLIKKLAIAGLTSGSVKTDDIHVVKAINLASHNIVAAINACCSSLGGRIPKTPTPPNNPGRPATAEEEIGGLDEEGLKELEDAEESLSHQVDSTEAINQQLRDMERGAGKWASILSKEVKGLSLSKTEVMDILKILQQTHNLNEKDLLMVQKQLNNFRNLRAYDKQRIIDALEHLKLAKDAERRAASSSPEKQAAAAANVVAAKKGVGDALLMASLNETKRTWKEFGTNLSYIINKFTSTVDKLGLGTLNFDPFAAMKLGLEKGAFAGQTAYQLSHERGNIENRGADTWQGALRDVFHEGLDKLGREEGLMPDEAFKLASSTVRRGITEAGQVKSIIKTSASLARQIGSDVNQTATELQDWVQRFNLSNVQARLLSQSIQKVGIMTGLTGDNLLQAVKSAQSLAEQMRQTGNMTSQANETLIQFSAVSQKLGSGQFTKPFIEGLTSADRFVNRIDKDTQSLLIQFAGMAPQAGAMEHLMRGTTLGSPEAMKNLAAGARNVLNLYTGGKKLKDMTADERSIADRQISGRTGGKYGLGSLFDLVKTLDETAETEEDKIKRLEGSLGNRNLGTAERKSIEKQIEQARSAQANKMDMKDLIAVQEGMGETKTLEEGLAAAGLTKESAEAKLLARAKEAGMSEEEAQKTARGGLTSGGAFNDALNAITEALEKKRAKEREEADPTTNLRRSIIELQNAFQKGIEELVKVILPALVPVIKQLIKWIIIVIDWIGELLDFMIGNWGNAEQKRQIAEDIAAQKKMNEEQFNQKKSSNPEVLAAQTKAKEARQKAIEAQGRLNTFNAGLNAPPSLASDIWNWDLGAPIARAFRFMDAAGMTAITGNPSGALDAGGEAARNPVTPEQRQKQADLEREALDANEEAAKAEKESSLQASRLTYLVSQKRLDLLEKKLAEYKKQRTNLIASGGTNEEQIALFTPELMAASKEARELRQNQSSVMAKTMTDLGIGAIPEGNKKTFEETIAKYAQIRAKKGKDWDASQDPIVQAMNKTIGINLPELEKKANEKLIALSEKGSEPGSIYVHDTRVVQRLDDLNDLNALVSTGDNDEMMQHRIATEFSGETNDSLGTTNATLMSIDAKNQKQVLLLQQMKEILDYFKIEAKKKEALAVREMLAGDTHLNTTPIPPADYHVWSQRPGNLPSYGGVENWESA